MFYFNNEDPSADTAESEDTYTTEMYRGYRIDTYESGYAEVLTADGSIIEGFSWEPDAVFFIDELVENNDTGTDDTDVKHVRGAGGDDDGDLAD